MTRLGKSRGIFRDAIRHRSQTSGGRREPTMGEWTVWHDLRQAIRAFHRQPGFASAAIAMLTLGIGATTAIFTVVKGVLIDPLPYPGSDALVRIVHNIGGIEQSYFNDAIITTYVENTHAFESLGVWIPSAAGVTITGSGEPEEVRALTASRGFFTTLGVQPTIGRGFSSEDDAPGSVNTAMLGSGYWQQKYGGDPGVVGRIIIIDARPHQIVGVMPAYFTFGGEFDVLLPLRIDPARLVPFFRLNGVGRMKPRITLAQANADIARMLEIYFDTFRVNTARAVKWVPSLVPLKQDVIGDVAPTLWVLMGTIALVLFMACANVANLMLVRAESRRQEFAIRVALGAKWTRVVQSLLVESMMLALIGGALGLASAYGGLRLLVAFEPANLPRLSEISMDPVTVMFAVGITLACGPLFTLIPIVRSFGSRFTAAIGGGARSMSLARERRRSQDLLVVVQMALALVLLVSSGLMIRSFQALRSVEPGFAQPHTLQTFSITIPPTMLPDLERVTRTQQEILDRITAIPGVASAAFTTRLPMDPSDRWSAALAAEDRPHDGRTTPPNRQVKVVSPGAFHTFGTPLAAGRDFTWTDLYELRDVAIVSENLAREMWGSAQGALGKRIRQFYGAKGPWREIVGVSGDVYDDGAQQPPPATVYWPARLDAELFAGYQPRRVSVVIRTDRAGTGSLLEELRQVVWSVNPNLPLANAATLDVLYTRSMSRTSFTLAMLAVAAAMALMLGICGIYGVIAYAVAQRRHEMGIRMALGAQARQVRALFLRRGMIVAAAGLLLGLTATALFTRLLQSLLFGINPLDPMAFTAMPIVLAAAALLATYLPTRRASSVDPVEIMKAE
jgi:putative ABC transport system permease protein